MTPRTKKFLSILLIFIIVLGIGIGTYLLFFTSKDNAMHVRRIGAQEYVDQKPENFKNSYLKIYPNETFEIELIHTIGDENITLFVGIGTYTKTKTSYIVTYSDSYTLTGAVLEQRKDITGELQIERNGRIRFDSSWGIPYYFGR